jgi:ketosteroid isomerase-like protein
VGADAAVIERFLEDYGAALSAGDGEAIAGMWDVPALVVSDDGAGDGARVVLTTADETAEHFSDAPTAYRGAGIVAIRAEHVTIEQLSDRYCTAEVRWLGIGPDGAPTTYRERSMYLLRSTGERSVRIQMAMHLPSRLPAE